jgi:hypothetical protein
MQHVKSYGVCIQSASVMCIGKRKKSHNMHMHAPRQGIIGVLAADPPAGFEFELIT